ncbi:MAG: hypothetical protein LBH03_03430 [Holophagales bacterium]|jgi:hypothetical protein|nr:hypothetical protein [Holophagales bacterium]
MKVHRLLRIGAALPLIGAFARAEEQSMFEVLLKIRTGIQATSFNDNLKHANYGYGLALAYNLNKQDKVSLEVGWAYKSGNEFKPDMSNLETAPGVVYDLDWAVGRVKNGVEGLAVRVAYERQFDGFGLVGGLQIGGSKYRHEYFGDVRSVENATTYFRDSFFGTLYNNPNSLSPFIGVTKRVSPFSLVELNIVGFRYKSDRYVHVTGYATGQNKDWSHDYIVTNSRMAVHFELGYAVRF